MFHDLDIVGKNEKKSIKDIRIIDHSGCFTINQRTTAIRAVNNERKSNLVISFVPLCKLLKKIVKQTIVMARFIREPNPPLLVICKPKAINDTKLQINQLKTCGLVLPEKVSRKYGMYPIITVIMANDAKTAFIEKL